MLSLLVIFVVLSIAGMIMLTFAVLMAPVGFEDADGFHAAHPGDLAASAPLEDLFLLDPQMASQPWS